MTAAGVFSKHQLRHLFFTGCRNSSLPCFQFSMLHAELATESTSGMSNCTASKWPVSFERKALLTFASSFTFVSPVSTISEAKQKPRSGLRRRLLRFIPGCAKHEPRDRVELQSASLVRRPPHLKEQAIWVQNRLWIVSSHPDISSEFSPIRESREKSENIFPIGEKGKHARRLFLALIRETSSKSGEKKLRRLMSLNVLFVLEELLLVSQ